MTAKKTTRKALPVRTGEVHAHEPVKAVEKAPVDYSTMKHSADVIAAAGLRNGMQPHEVHAAIARVLGEPK